MKGHHLSRTKRVWEIISRFTKRLPALAFIGLLWVRDVDELPFALDSVAIASGNSSTCLFHVIFAPDKVSLGTLPLMIPGSSKVVAWGFPAFLTEINCRNIWQRSKRCFSFRNETSYKLDLYDNWMKNTNSHSMTFLLKEDVLFWK